MECCEAITDGYLIMKQTLTENLGIVADIVEAAEKVHSAFDACPKCSKNRSELQEQLDAANASLRFAVKCLRECDERRADWRLDLSPDLDRFARMLLEKRCGIARRVIRQALEFYRCRLQQEALRQPPYGFAATELSHVSACLLELCDWSEN